MIQIKTQEDMRKNREIKGVGTTDFVVVTTNVGVAEVTSAKTNEFNAECSMYRSTLATKVQENQRVLDEKLYSNRDYVGDRNKAVDLAYEYETADLKMGGKGSANWNPSERDELLETGKVRGCEGHHINSVAENPSQQTDPNNIRFYRSHKEHLQKGHNGNFRKPSSGELIDKDRMLEKTNEKRVVINEVQGVVIATTIGAGVGVASSVCETCKEEGVSFNSIKKGFKKSGKPALLSALASFSSYAMVRVLEHFFK